MDLNSVVPDIKDTEPFSNDTSNKNNLSFFSKYKNLLVLAFGGLFITGYIGYQVFSYNTKNSIKDNVTTSSNIVKESRNSSTNISRTITTASDTIDTLPLDDNTNKQIALNNNKASPKPVPISNIQNDTKDTKPIKSTTANINKSTVDDEMNKKALFSNTTVQVKYTHDPSKNIKSDATVPNATGQSFTTNNTSTASNSFSASNTSYSSVSSPRTILPGTIIKGVLVNTINSDLPGIVLARVTESIYDKSGNIVLPQGTTLLCDYDNSVEFFQTRLLITWKRMVLPDGTVVDCNENVSDKLGQSGMPSHVNRHIFLRTFGIALSFVYSTSYVVATNGASQLTPAGQQVVEATTKPVFDLSGKIVDRSLNVPNTLTVKQGTILDIITFNTITF